MPIKHAALKQIRKDHKRQQYNQSARSELKSLSKDFLTLLKEQKLDEAGKLLRLVAKKYDRAASRHIIHRNTAARSKSRLTRQLAQRASVAPGSP